MKRRVTVIILLVLLPLVQAQAQQIPAIHGSVVNTEGKAIEYANIILLKAQDSAAIGSTLADESGKFHFTSVKAGTYIIAIKQLGYQQAFSQSITVTGQSVTIDPIMLTPTINQLAEVTVQGQKPLLEVQEDKVVMQVENSVLASGGTGLEIIEKAPGVSIDQNGGISVNGRAGVMVMINGKQVNLPAEEVTNMLRNMSANAIEAVEVITNPSAKYDAAGNAGIINIRLKKGLADGTNGSITAGTGYGKYGKANAGINLNTRGDNFNLFGNYNYLYNKRFVTLDLKRSVTHEGKTTYFDQFNHRPSFSHSHTYQAGADFTLSKNDQLGILFNGNNYMMEVDPRNTTDFRSSPTAAPDSALQLKNHIDTKWFNYTLNANYKHSFAQKGHEITADVDYSSFDFQQNDNITTNFTFTNPAKPTYSQTLRSDVPADISILVFKSDYALPLGQGTQLETGVKMSQVTTQTDILYEEQHDNVWRTDETRTNDFLYTENISAAYVNFSKQINKFRIQAGLRAEHTLAEGESERAESTDKRDYLEFFPSISVKQQLSDKYNVGLSYSRRVDRPVYRDLFPFIFFMDPYTYVQGNPNLQPQFTNTIQLSGNYNNRYTLTLGYSHTEDFFTNITRQDDETGIGYASKENFKDFYNYNLSLIAPIVVTNWWVSNNNVSVFYNEFNTFFLGEKLDIGQLSGTVNSSNSFKLPNGLAMELSALYQSPTVMGAFHVKSNYNVNLGIQKQVLQQRGSIRLSITDIFKTSRMSNTIDFANMNMDMDSRWESRQVRLNFTYNFGNKDLKPLRRRSSVSEEELRRASQSN
ncbi:outer membrane beta-barrel protein [Pontibacter anaerobius]|uniref:TonB-dependent receptor n=1 Tax=Pontibacter anaerobius TaxID=2993940 RepID=A0ABT3RIM2_9BACT|nr:outer membrane beta-barrel protein [Pontibacter anaerobius]MCX2741707.1 TonB-dependent receptor [Pontibacter anaerobius]